MLKNLPDDILITIYRFKHQLEFHEVLDQLVEYKLHCHFTISLKQAREMHYIWQCFKIPSIRLSEIFVTPYELLSLINSK